jgi:Tfp pilus assembly protein PilZ
VSESSPGDNVIQLRFLDKPAVYSCYMSFCKDGGIFVPQRNKTGNNPNAHLGAHIFLVVHLPENTATFLASGRVAWVTFGKRAGVGVRLNGDEWGRKLNLAIQNLLAGNLRSTSPTLTF